KTGNWRVRRVAALSLRTRRGILGCQPALKQNGLLGVTKTVDASPNEDKYVLLCVPQQVSVLFLDNLRINTLPSEGMPFFTAWRGLAAYRNYNDVFAQRIWSSLRTSISDPFLEARLVFYSCLETEG